MICPHQNVLMTVKRIRQDSLSFCSSLDFSVPSLYHNFHLIDILAYYDRYEILGKHVHVYDDPNSRELEL